MRTLLLILALVSVPVVLLLLVGLSLPGWLFVEPAAGEVPGRQESAAVTLELVNETLGYSLHYPGGYSVEEQENGDLFVIGNSMNHTDPRLEVALSIGCDAGNE